MLNLPNSVRTPTPLPLGHLRLSLGHQGADLFSCPLCAHCTPMAQAWCFTRGCKVPPGPPDLDSLRTVFSFLCHAGADAPLGAVRWVLGTPNMGASSTPAGWAVAGGSSELGVPGWGGTDVNGASLWQVFLGLESQGLVASQVSASRS